MYLFIYLFPYMSCVRVVCCCSDKLAVDECAKSLETLTRLACNPECISTLVDGLAPSLAAILDVAEHQDASGFDRLVCCLLNQIVKVRRRSHRIRCALPRCASESAAQQRAAQRMCERRH